MSDWKPGPIDNDHIISAIVFRVNGEITEVIGKIARGPRSRSHWLLGGAVGDKVALEV